MNKANSFPKGKQNACLGTSKQYNAIVNYIISRKFGVKAGCLTDYDKLVKYFSELLWEIDPHYHKLKTRGMLFLKSVEKNFLGFNKPASHGHAPKRLSSESLSLHLHEGAKSLSVYRQKLYGFFTHEIMKILSSETFLPTHRVKLSGRNASRKCENYFKVKMYTNRSL